jgi:hypothetical protein
MCVLGLRGPEPLELELLDEPERENERVFREFSAVSAACFFQSGLIAFTA